ncbi:riboflavin synthase subunit beta [Ichthyenterobacterium sp. W332]|uniref:Riboflavin synthase subunit beta n=1 Tax=Microcosmobacter mediterraneus TaxID=3075607 RepID=A0ABU2YG87_9FLAO|nr:riboflavin synthase subunit beta [Ichthyenterobacterium sp. W332]MDT0557199.1 riboflavin synthase subunit beta [Ichthyenterobacterium sp. W332]
MGLFKQRANKRFDYKPRYYKGDGNPYEIKHKFDEFRTTVGTNSGIKNKFNKAMDDHKNNPNESANRRVAIIIGLLILIFLVIIEFDLSIFLS